MKKSLFFYAAAAALMLTACSSEDDILQTGQTKQAAPQEVGFDVYTPAATNVTRAGLEGTMTTGRLQRSEYEGGGFGVYAYLIEDEDNTVAATGYNRNSPIAPNFMVNEKLLWNATNQGWYYNPLKYWPNETNTDSQDTPAYMESDHQSTGGTPAYDDMHLDRLTFFAYAPYVETAVSGKPGITAVTNNQGKFAKDATTANDATGASVREASLQYMASLDDPNKAVDLLWGVAPAGGLTYTAVNGEAVFVKEGEPLIDMTKPNVNTSMKFLFQHALARIGVTAVAAIDQVGAGGTLDPNTKITIKEITLTGLFGENGFLNLDNNVANVANWVNINGTNITSSTTGLTTTSTITISGDAIAEHLRYKAPTSGTAPVEQEDRSGVTTIRQNVIAPATINNTAGTNRNWYTMKHYAANDLAYSETTPYYKTKDCDNASSNLYSATITATGGKKIYTIDSKGNYTEIGTSQSLTYPNVNKFYVGDFGALASSDLTDPTYKDAQTYTKSGSGNVYTPNKVGTPLKVGDYVIGSMAKAEPKYATEGDYYKRDANYFMVVPTNNVKAQNSGLAADKEKELRTVRVKIEYYITTEDSNLAAGRAQTKNVIEKDVIFPSLANGKSYNLNLILGLTSVKMEAEVDDWKVINVQADLPQNTAD